MIIAERWNKGNWQKFHLNKTLPQNEETWRELLDALTELYGEPGKCSMDYARFATKMGEVEVSRQ